MLHWSVALHHNPTFAISTEGMKRRAIQPYLQSETLVDVSDVAFRIGQRD